MKTGTCNGSKSMKIGWSILSISIGVFAIAFTPVQAQVATQSRGKAITPIVKFEPVDDGKTLDDSRGGASRRTQTQCSQDTAYLPPMMPLIPISQAGLTVASHPTFWVYIPQTSAPQAHFTLRDENNRGIYQTLLPIAKAGEIVKITLPDDQPALELGKTYQWSVALICQPTQTDIPIVSGKIRRVELDWTLQTQLEKKNSLDQAALYGQAGVWYDMLNSLAQLKKTQPNETTIAANWVHLLNSVGLEEIATKPLQ